VFAGVSGQLLHRMQVIQNAAAHLVTGAMKYQRMPQVLRSLHWLPVRQQITFKTTVTVGLYKCLAPPYLTEHIRCWPPTPTICQHAPARHPTSEDKLRWPQLVCPWTNCMERFAVVYRHFAGHVQEQTENISVW